ncbi:MAG: glycosyltransferase [Chromatiaceae bacterium]|nr:glycosyltransferase [Chromatiaceae bacterium]MCF7995057.1 glycosyltransferase [Chromatiaceae bacterium]MCF8015960.1 glycosyltransferase [Chromatiaceae bacterium]
MPHRSAQPPSPPKSPRCRLALVVIARNEAATLRACLESARGLVESIILLDTGSSDETVVIAQACGAQAHRSLGSVGAAGHRCDGWWGRICAPSGAAASRPQLASATGC